MPRRDNERSEKGVAAREAALRLLDAALRRGETLDGAARAATRGLPPADARLAQAIAGETIRRLPDLDALIDDVMERPLPDDAKARNVLRLALAQRIAMDIPPHAVVSTALPLVAKGPRRLVHGVLSRLLKSDLPTLDTPALPGHVAERWGHWGMEALAGASHQLGRRPPLDLSLKSDDVTAPTGKSLASRHIRVGEEGGVTTLPGFDEGGWWVQDLAASIPARLVPATAKRVLDACAAPGGKTLQLAAAGHHVTALDLSEKRLKLLRENLARTGLSVEVVAGDLRKYRPGSQFDAVLLDAPCSATGTFRRHPEILYRATDRIIGEMAALQAELLDAAATMVAPGGSLIFATCSLEREEGEAQVESFTARHKDFAIAPADPGIEGIMPGEQGWLRLLPDALDEAGGVDSFFIAHLVRRGE